MKKGKLNIIRAILIIIIIFISSTIFGFSNQNSEESSGVSSRVAEILIKIQPRYKNISDTEKEELIEQYQTPVRKFAHFSIYTLLGMSIAGLTCTYGINNKDSNYVAENIEFFENKSIFNMGKEQFDVPVAGEHFVLNALCAIAVGRYFDISIDKIKQGILNLELSKNRMEIINLKNDITVINDTYNANFDSMKAAIEYLEKIEDKRKIAILGDMLELGEYSEELHRKIGDIINNIDILITVGNLSKYINENAKISQKFHCDNIEEATSKIIDIMNSGDVILLKASNSMKFSKITEELKKGRLLW